MSGEHFFPDIIPPVYDKSQHVPKFPLVIFSVVSYQCEAIFRGMTSWLKVRPKGFEDMCYKKEGVMLNSGC